MESLQNIESIVGFFLNLQNNSFEDKCLLDIDFIIKDKEKQYITYQKRSFIWREAFSSVLAVI